ncbi:MAG: PH domain-containing protein [Gemmatimonadaceae bacterium]
MPSTDTSAAAPDEVFRSRVDLWLVALIAVGIGVPIVIVSGPGTDPTGALVGRAMVGVTSVLLVLFLSWLYRTTRYTLGPDALTVQSGPENWRIPYRDVKSVRRSLNPLSAPALSIRRLKILYGPDAWVLISPPDREAFIAALGKRVPGLEVER